MAPLEMQTKETINESIRKEKRKAEHHLGVWSDSGVALLDDQRFPLHLVPNYQLVNVPPACCGRLPVAPVGLLSSLTNNTPPRPPVPPPARPPSLLTPTP